MSTITLGVDVACRAAHQASCADATGQLLWSGRRFRTTPTELEQLWALLGENAEVTVVIQPTRNAWAPLAAWFSSSRRQSGAGAPGAVRGSA
jgi:transposase